MNTQVKFILGLDGGGTKTLARLISLKDHQQWQTTQGATSLTNDFNVALNSVTAACQELFALGGCQAQQVAAVFGVAGSGDSRLVSRFVQQLSLSFAHVDVVSDGKTSLYGANQGRPVAVVALGTGSVGMRMEKDGRLQQIGGWGFCIGDEGGGAKLGALAVQKLLLELDLHGGAQSQLGLELAKRVGQCRESALQWLAQARPGDFAQLAPQVFTLRGKCKVAMEVLETHGAMVEQLIHKTRGDSGLPIVILGGLAQPSKALLGRHTRALIIPAKGDALDGACLLARQHAMSHRHSLDQNGGEHI